MGTSAFRVPEAKRNRSEWFATRLSCLKGGHGRRFARQPITCLAWWEMDQTVGHLAESAAVPLDGVSDGSVSGGRVSTTLPRL